MNRWPAATETAVEERRRAVTKHSCVHAREESEAENQHESVI